MTNPFEQAVADLQKTQVGFDAFTSESANHLKRSYALSNTIKNPERSGKLLQKVRETGLGIQYVDRNLEDMEGAWADEESLNEDLLQRFPRSARFLSDTDHASVATGDIDSLKKIEDEFAHLSKNRKEVGGLGGAFALGVNSVKSAGAYRLYSAGLIDADTAAEYIADQNKKSQAIMRNQPDYVTVYQKELEDQGSRLNESLGWLLSKRDEHYRKAAEQGLKDYAENKENSLYETLLFILKASQHPRAILYESIQSLATSSPALVSSLVGSRFGRVGLVGSSFAGNALTESGAWTLGRLVELGIDTTDKDSILEAFRDKKLIRRLNREGLKKGYVTAGVDATTNLFTGRLLAGAGKSVKSKVARGAGEVAIQAGSETVGEGLGQLAAVGEVNVAESLREGIVGGFTGVSEIGLGILSDKPKVAIKKGAEKLRDKLSRNPIKALQNLAFKTKKAVEVQQDVVTLQTLSMHLQNSQVKERYPDAVFDLMEDNDDHVYFQTEAWDGYWQSKGESPVQKVKEISEEALQAYLEAKETGSDFGVVTKEYSSKVETEDFDGLLPHLQRESGVMTVSESQEFLGQVETTMDGLVTEMEKLDSDGDEAKYIFDDIKQKLVDAGDPENLASVKAKVIERQFVALSKRLDMTPKEAYEGRELTIERKDFSEFEKERRKILQKQVEEESQNRAKEFVDDSSIDTVEPSETEKVVTQEELDRAEKKKLQKTPEKKKEKKSDTNHKNIQDFGEKLEGARKFLNTYRSEAGKVPDKDILKVPLKTFFPELNPVKMVENGVPKRVAFILHALRFRIPKKPNSRASDYKQKSWAEQVVELKSIANVILDNVDKITDSGTFTKKFNEIMDKSSGRLRAEYSWIKDLVEISDHVLTENLVHLSNINIGKRHKWKEGIDTLEARKAISKVQYGSREKYEEARAKYIDEVYEVKPDNEKKALPFDFGQFVSKEDTTNEIRIQLSEKPVKEAVDRKTKLEIFYDRYNRKGTEVYIGKKVAAGKYIELERFDSSKEAREHLKSDENYQKLVDKLARLKDTTSLRREGNQPRMGENYRKGKDVTPEDFDKTFGFRGVQFGNWVEQERRQEDLNNAYDALIDLASVLDIPIKAISLNGRLGLAFGARGKKGASAHFETLEFNINLTKKHGPGSLAHEWWHALDRYFGDKGNIGAYQLEKLSRMGKGFSLMDSPEFYLTEQMAQRLGQHKKEGDNDGGDIRAEVLESMDKIRGYHESHKYSGQLKRSETLDRRKAKDYYSKIVEMTARSFEAYVIQKLKEKQAENDYLANIKTLEEWETAEKDGGREGDTYPYPNPDELKDVVPLYDDFFKILQTRETDKGIELYQSQVLFQEKRNLFQKLSDKFSGKKRGAFDPNKMTITLFESEDLSTFLHESAHYFLEVYKDVYKSGLGNEEFRSDMETTLKYLGIDSFEKLSTENHEKFAKAFETYLMEGKAPSLELRDVFSRIKLWLLDIYKSVRGLNVKLNDEIRGVFDRMLATEEEINQAKQKNEIVELFTTAEDAGMTEEEFKNYKKTAEQAHLKAKEDLEQKYFSQFKREKETWWKTKRKEVRERVVNDLNKNRDYSALSVLQKGKTPGGEERILKISTQSIVAQFGKERLKGLPRGIHAADERGVDVDLVAEQLGYGSADEMLTILANLPLFSDEVENITDTIMSLDYGDMMVDGSAVEEARVAVNNSQEAIVKAEMKAIRKLQKTVSPHVNQEKKLTQEGIKSIVEGVPTRAILRKAAKRIIDSKKVRHIKPYDHYMTSGQLSKQALNAIKKKDYQKALLLKKKQLLSIELHRQSNQAKQDIQKSVKYLKKFREKKVREKIAKAGEEYLDQIEQILERFELKEVTLKRIDKRQSIASWVKAQEEAGLPTSIPDYLMNEIYQKNYKELTFEELMGIVDAVKHIEYRAKFKNKLITAKKHRDLNELADQLSESIKTNGKKKKNQSINLKDRVSLKDDILASMLKGNTIATRLDGGREGGLFWENFMRVFNEAGDRAAVMKAEAAEALDSIFSVYSEKERREFGQKVYIESIGNNLTKEQIMAVELNFANEDNREKLMAGRNWTMEQVEDIRSYLDDRDRLVAQKIRDHLDSYWTELEALAKRVNDIAPPKLENYYPLKYDTVPGTSLQALEEDMREHFGQGYAVRSLPASGSRKERVSGVKRPIYLSLSVVSRHIDSVIHDITHYEAVLNTRKILTHPKVSNAIINYHGADIYRELDLLVENISSGNNQAVGGIERIFSYLRVGKVMSTLGFSIKTALYQPLGLAISAKFVGPKYILRGAQQFFGSPEKMSKVLEEIQQESEFMRIRPKTLMREANEVLNTLGDSAFVEMFSEKPKVQKLMTLDGKLTPLGRSMKHGTFYMTARAQLMADVPTYLGAKLKARVENPEADEATIIQIANEAVLKTQGGGQLKDLARAQKGSELKKIATVFFSFFSVLYNRLSDVKYKFDRTGDISILLADVMGYLMVPALLDTILNDAIGSDEEDESFVEQYGKQIVAYPLSTVPGIREMSGWVMGYRPTSAPGFSFFADVQGLATQIKQGELDGSLIRSLNRVGGTLFHYPATQIDRTVRGVRSLAEGEN